MPYVVFRSRLWKRIYKIDHNVAPRDDIATYGQAAVREGKISQWTLNTLKRIDAASANATESFPLFVSSGRQYLLSSISTANRLRCFFRGHHFCVIYANLEEDSPHDACGSDTK